MENDNIRQLLEMLDRPDAYTEQEILDIVNRDEDTREAYRLMVEAKRSSRHRQHRQQPADVDAAWQRFNEELRAKPSSRFTLHASLQKMAAAFIGVLLVSSIALAAIHTVRHSQHPQAKQTADTTATVNASRPALPASLPEDTAAAQPVTFDNVPLDQMLTQIAAYHHAEAVFQSDEARSLRFYFVWYREQPLGKVVETLNRFEHVDIEMTDQKLLVR